MTEAFDLGYPMFDLVIVLGRFTNPTVQRSQVSNPAAQKLESAQLQFLACLEVSSKNAKSP